jgi:IS5 family transposase
VHLDEGAAPFDAEEGRPGIPTRLMVGLHVLNHKFTLSDEEVCARRGYDPYFRSFCGEVYFQASVSH